MFDFRGHPEKSDSRRRDHSAGGEGGHAVAERVGRQRGRKEAEGGAADRPAGS